MRAFFGMSSSRSSRGGDEILGNRRIVALSCRCFGQRLNLSEVPLLVLRVILDTLRRPGSFRKLGVIVKVGFSCSFNESDSGWSRLCSLGSSLGKTCLDFDSMLAIHCGDQSVPRSQLIPELVS